MKHCLSVLEGLGHIAVVGGIVFVALEFAAQQQDKRERNALDFLRVIYDPEITDARFRLQAYWFDKNLSRLSGLPGSAGVVDSLAMAQIFPDGASTNVADLMRIIEQLDVMGICVSSSTCDQKIISEQIGDYVENLLCLYQAPLVRLRVDYALPDLGLAAAGLVVGGVNCRGVR